MDYIAQADVEKYLGVTLTTAGQNTFNTLLPLLQDMIDQYCNRTWNFANPVTENFDALQEVTAPYATDTFFTKYPISETPYNADIPLAAGIRSVTIGGISWDMHFVYSYKTHVKLWVRPQTITLPNPLGFKSVQIVYNSDDAGTVPGAIKAAFIQWMARLINTAPDAGKEATRAWAGTTKIEFAADKVGGIPDFVRLALDQYRIPVVDHF